MLWIALENELKTKSLGCVTGAETDRYPLIGLQGHQAATVLIVGVFWIEEQKEKRNPRLEV